MNRFQLPLLIREQDGSGGVLCPEGVLRELMDLMHRARGEIVQRREHRVCGEVCHQNAFPDGDPSDGILVPPKPP